MDTRILIDYFENRISEKDNSVLTEWLESPSNKREYEELKKLWEASKHARVFYTVNHEAAFHQVVNSLPAYEISGSKHRLHFRTFMKIAASVALILSLAFAYNYYSESIRWVEYTATIETRTVHLVDGSIVTLNKNSTLKVNQEMNDERELTLDGEAFFKVSRDEDRPFKVSANGLEVKVLGTSFNVNSDSNQTKVTVQSGKVRVSKLENMKNNLLLLPNQQAILNNHEGSLQKGIYDQNSFAWKTGIFKYENELLLTAIRQLADYHQVQLKFKNEKLLKQCTITSVFDNQSWSQVLEELQLLYILDVTKLEGDSVQIEGSCQ